MSSTQTFNAELVINAVEKSMNKVRTYDDTYDVFISYLSLLYAFHKGYSLRIVELMDSQTVEVDNLLRELIDYSSKDPNVVGQLKKFSAELEEYDRIAFNEGFPNVLKGLFDFLSISQGRSMPCFYTPESITKLMAYFLKEENCQSVYDPFCGSASILDELYKLHKGIRFKGQELYKRASLLGRVFTESITGEDKCIETSSSIENWAKEQYDAVISCPPLGPNPQMKLMKYDGFEQYGSWMEMACIRPFIENEANITVTMGVGLTESQWASDARRYLIDNNLLDKVVYLPKGILYETGISPVIMVCKKRRKEGAPITFIHADEYFTGNVKFGEFDFSRFESMMRSEASDCVYYSREQVISNEYSLSQAYYVNDKTASGNGIQYFKLGDLITPVKSVAVKKGDNIQCIPTTSFRSYFMDVLLNANTLSSKKQGSSEVKKLLDFSKDDYFLLSIFSPMMGSKYALYKGDEEFSFPAIARVYKINTEKVDPEFLVYTLLNNERLKKSGTSSILMRLPIAIDDRTKQIELVKKAKQEYIAEKSREEEAERKRLNVARNISDLEHMLGVTNQRIKDLIAYLELKLPKDSLVKSLKDNIEYMNRIIHYNNSSIESSNIYKKEGDIKDFIRKYIDGWRNYGETYFDLQLVDEIDESITLSFDKSMLTVMLDSILSNAGRHGFNKHKLDTNLAQIRLSLVTNNGIPSILISVANNGIPFKEDFTINDYISRGRFTGDNGRSGLGGYHVYQIVKGHDGYLYINRNKIWNVIVDIILPLGSNKNSDDFINYEHENECI